MTGTSVHEIRHHIRVDLTNAPPLTDLVGHRRKPIGVHLTYGLRRDITRVDIAIQWEGEASLWSLSHEMPDWLRQVVDRYRPADVDDPDEARPTGKGGWPLYATPQNPTNLTATTDPGMTELARTRQELSTWLYKGVRGTRAHERVTELVDAHQSAVKDVLAHRLAEQQRDHLRSHGYDLGCVCGSCTCCVVKEFIDLIDPEAQR